MKKYIFIVLLFVICIGCFFPTGVFASEFDVLNKININYYFSLKDNDNGNLRFKLYDMTNSLVLDSKYDESSDSYYFNYQKSTINRNWDSCSQKLNEGCRFCAAEALYNYNCHNKAEHSLPLYFKYINEINNNEYNNIVNLYIDKQVHGQAINTFYTFYDYIPLIIENMKTNEKVIVLAAYNYYNWYAHSTELNLVNTLYNYVDSNEMFFEKYSDIDENINFMKNAVYEYSIELFEQFNNNPVASSELFYDNIASDSNNTISNISNPKTFNNGMLIIIFSIIIVIGSSVLIINKKKNKGDV